MGILNSILSADTPWFTDPDAFGELVTYYKRDGTQRQIYAAVMRGGLKALPGQAKAGYPIQSIAIANSATTGIAAAELANGDRIGIADYPGGPLVNRGLNIASKKIDGAMLSLDVI
jgi:hypothetical protein